MRPRPSTRVAVLAAALGLALLGATEADAAYSPTLGASTTSTGVTVGVSVAATDDPTESVTFYVPAAFIPATSLPEGTTLGTVTAKFALGDQGGTIVSATAPVTAAAGADPVTVAGASTTIAGADKACQGAALTGATPSGGYMLTALNLSGQTLQIPMYVTPVTLSFSSDLVQFCLPSPSLPAGSAARAPLGARLTSLQIAFLPTFMTEFGGGKFLWSSVETPFLAGSATPASSGAEADSQDVSAKLSLAASTAAGGVHLSGKLATGAKGVTIKFLAGKKVVGKTTTKSKGAFAATIKVQGHPKVSAQASVPTSAPGTCTQPRFAPAPCSQTTGGFTVSSKAVKG